jgi:hypothetical protein
MKRTTALGVAAGVLLVLAVIGLAAVSRGRFRGGEGLDDGTLASSMRVDALVAVDTIERAANAQPGGAGAKYPTYVGTGVAVLALTDVRLTEPDGPSSDIPPVHDPLWMAGHALDGPIPPVPDLKGELLVGLYLWPIEFQSEDMPVWHIAWVAEGSEDGDVMIYEGGGQAWDLELETLAGVLGRRDQEGLLVDWVNERMSEKAGTAKGPITLAWEQAFVQPQAPTLPPPDIEVPLYLMVDEIVDADSGEEVVVQPEGVENSLPASRPLSAGSGSMTVLMLSGTRMTVEVWDDGIRVAGTALEAAEWEAAVSGGVASGGVVVHVTTDSAGTYWVTAELVDESQLEEIIETSKG